MRQVRFAVFDRLTIKIYIMNISQTDIITAGNLFLVVGGTITLFGALLLYFSKKPKRRK